MIDDVPIDEDDLMDEWIATGFHRGVLFGVTATIMAVGVLFAVRWMLS